jgi:hypothetical protein
MNDLFIDLIRTRVKSRFRRILGFSYVILVILWLVVKVIYHNPLSWFDILYSVVFGISGVVFIIDGYGVSFSRFFGEAFIKIDTTDVRVKKGVFSKEWVLKWSDIEQVEYTVIKIMFRLKSGISRDFEYDNLDYEHIQQIKEVIRNLADEKSIEVIISGLVRFPSRVSGNNLR